MLEQEKKFVKVLTVKHVYKVEDRNFVTLAVPDYSVARVVDTEGNIITIRTPYDLNVGDEIDIISKEVREYNFQPDIITITTVLRNYTQQRKIKEFMAKNKTKSR